LFASCYAVFLDVSFFFYVLASHLHLHSFPTRRSSDLSFKHPERERFIRANKLGADYEREGLEHVFARQIEREQEHERAISRNEGTQRTDEKLYQSSHE